MNFEALFIGLVLMAALVPLGLALLPGCRQMGHNRLFVCCALACCALAGLGLGWDAGFRRPPDDERVVQGRPIEVQRTDYVTSDTCRACHPHQYGTWHSSYHRTMTQVASPEAVLGDFEKDVVQHNEGSIYRLSREGDQYWVKITRSDEEEAKRYPIVMTTGSHHRQFYWYSTMNGREVRDLPFIWQIDERRWIPFKSALLIPPSAHGEAPAGRWNTTCIRCHATNGHIDGVGPLEQPSSFDTTVAEFGIACEACHGPAADHVRVNQDPLRRMALHRGEEPDPTIQNPASLDRRRGSQVCGQCHSDLLFQSDEDYRYWLEHGFAYRPGEDLEKTRFIGRPSLRPWPQQLEDVMENNPTYLEGVFWPDGMARVTGSEYNGMVQSPCYLHADEAKLISCLDCHVMHQAVDDLRPRDQWANDQLQPAMYGNQACSQCHKELGEDIALVAHSHHAADSSGSLCYNCHMPHTAYGLYTAVRSHQISSPSVEVSLLSGRPDACNLCHLDRSLGWTAQHLEEWYDIPAPELTDDEQQIAGSLLWLLRGDAGQRALVAWSMGWEPARQSSDTQWLAPYLGLLLEDPYAAVRIISFRSLTKIDGFDLRKYDFLDPYDDTDITVLRLWQNSGDRRPQQATLIGLDGQVMMEEVQRLYRQRDNRNVFIRE